VENKDRRLYRKTRTGVLTGKQGQESLQENKDRSPYRKTRTGVLTGNGLQQMCDNVCKQRK
jgi:hypothetical protein